MARREFLQLAKPFKPEKSKIAGFYASEKLDGTRCFWDGGITRGMRTVDVLWSSLTNPKTGEPKPKVKPVATGLWSRYGNPIMAPDWFLDQLPKLPLDGELWAGRGKFQLCRSICAGDNADPRFDQIQYAVYSMPGARIWASGEIKNSNFHRRINGVKCMAFVQAANLLPQAKWELTFEQELEVLREHLATEPVTACYLHEQIKLSGDEEEAVAEAKRLQDEWLEHGAEGIVIRNPNAMWTPKRVNDLLKWKPWEDDEGMITGFTSGRKTDKGSKHLGKIGALILDFDGKRLELSGLTDIEREFLTPEMCVHASEFPGEDMNHAFQGKHFKVGQQVTFKYRELSDDGIPKEARYWRKRDVE
jgi:DNA ligase-1